MRRKVKKVLVISPALPYPPTYGLRIPIYQLVKSLHEFGLKVHVVIITPSLSLKEIEICEFKEWSQKIGITYKIFQISQVKAFFNLFRNIKKPLQVNYFYSGKVQQYINHILKKEAFDMLVSFLVRTAEYVLNSQSLERTVKILAMIDLISLNYKRAITTSVFPWNVIYRYEIPRLENYEKECLEKFDRVLLVSKYEYHLMSERYNNVIWFPNAVSDTLINYSKTDSRYKNWIVFFGKMNYQPNIYAVLWFVKNVFKYFKNSKIKFAIIGKNPSRFLRKKLKKISNVLITGYVDDPYIILRSSLAVVAPLKTGAGIPNKVIESMAVEGLVVLTSLAAKSVGGVNMRDYIIADTPEEYKTIINDIIANPGKYDFIRKNARNFIITNLSFSHYKERLKLLLKSVNVED